MGMEIEAAGDLVTAGLVAKEVEGNAGQAAGKVHHAPCANCGTPVTASYCGNCGQKGHLHKSVLHLGEELIHGLLHFDTKGWRTMPLLIARPGQLTRRYIDGQRTRFVSPLALFLFMMFFMFFVFSLTMGTSVGTPTATSTDAANGKARFEEKMNEKMAEQETLLKEIEAEIAAAEPGSNEAELLKRKLATEQKEYDGLKYAKAAGSVAMASTGKFIPTPPKQGKTQETEKVKEPGIIEEIVKSAEVEMLPKKDNAKRREGAYSDIEWINKGVKHAVENPELAKYKLKNAAYKYSFLLVPISMPFLWLMFFWRRGISMYDHAVFSLYSLSFMSLLFTLVATLSYFGFNGWAASLFVFVPPVHMFLQLRGAYMLSRFGALWRTCALLFMTVLVLTLYALVILALSAT